MISHSKPWISDLDVAAVVACLKSNMIAEGSATADLEATLANRFSYSHAVATGSGCQALLLALRAFDVDASSEVILPTYVCPEVLGVVEHLGATPVLADVGLDYLLSFDDAQRLVTRKTAAIIVPYLFGIDCDLTELKSLGIPLIADWAQYLPPAFYSSRTADLSVLSFEATKMIAAGEGGAVLSHLSLGRKIASLKKIEGSNCKLNLFPLSDLQAALAASQMAHVDVMMERRKRIAELYFEELAGLSAISLPNLVRSRSVFFRFPIRVRASAGIDRIVERSSILGVSIKRPVDTMLHHVRSVGREFPLAQSLFESTISLPIYPAMTDQEIGKVISVTREIFN